MYENVFGTVDTRGELHIRASQRSYNTRADALIYKHVKPGGGWAYLGTRKVTESEVTIINTNWDKCTLGHSRLNYHPR